jgi:hypothetical protein
MLLMLSSLAWLGFGYAKCEDGRMTERVMRQL